MNEILNDVPDVPLIVMDLEWVGNSFVPLHTHLVDIACLNPVNNARFSALVKPLAPRVSATEARAATVVLKEWLAWIECQRRGGDIVLIAHNGIRFDGPVLLNALQRCGLAVPTNVYMMDSLYHLRHHLRYRVPKTMKYDVDSLCAYYNISVDVERRHGASYDVDLLAHILISCAQEGLPFISGRRQLLSELSTMLVHGIGPAVSAALPVSGLRSLCEAILDQYPDLGKASCAAYLRSIGLDATLPLCDIPTVAASIEVAATRYLQYLETGA